MKKLIFGIALLLVVLPCFGDLKYRHNVSGMVTLTSYWDTNYCGDFSNMDLIEDCERMEMTRISQNYYRRVTISHFIIGDAYDDIYYRVVLMERNDRYDILVTFSDGDFYEKLDNQSFYYYNDAKACYDEWCDTFKNYVRKNYHHYK